MFLFPCTTVQAEKVSLTGSQDGTKSWLTATSWSNGAEPSADNDYVVGNGYTLRTPTDSAHTFGGKSLTLGDDTSSGILYLKTAEKGTATINDLRLVNGTIQQAVSYTTTLEGNITVNGSGTIKGDPNSNNTRSLIVNAPISGSGTLTLDTPGQNHVIELNENITGNDLTLAQTGGATLLLTGDSNIKSMTQHGGGSGTGTTILTETGKLCLNQGLKLTNSATFIIEGFNSIASDGDGIAISFNNGSLTLFESGKLRIHSGNIDGNGTFNFSSGTLEANQPESSNWTLPENVTTILTMARTVRFRQLMLARAERLHLPPF